MSSQEDLELNVDRINFEKDLKLFESKGYALGEEAMIDLSTDSSKEKGKVKRKDNNQKLKETKGLKKVKSEAKKLGYRFIHSSQLEFRNLDFFIPCRSLYRKL